MLKKISLPAAGRVALTLAVAAAALACGWYLWRHYEIEPWTRDARVRANLVQLAPDVSGQVVKVRVHDNQLVQAGQVLFEIDRARFELAERQAAAAVQLQRTLLGQAVKEAKRNAQLGELVAQEIREQGNARVGQAQAALEQALANHATAQLNLERTRVLAPANGYVTNLDLQAGAYVTAARPVLVLVDRDSFYVEGYFEENKLPRIHVGDGAAIKLMGDTHMLSGHVESFAEGIVDRDRSTGNNLLPNVNPTVNWVRLAQRIPVRIKLDHVPDGMRLIAGQTATVEIEQS